MNTKQIAESVNRNETTVRRWAVKLAGKMPVINDKMTASSPMKPADYTLDETIAIIETGMGKNAAAIYRSNAERAASVPAVSTGANNESMDDIKKLLIVIAKNTEVTKTQLKIESRPIDSAISDEVREIMDDIMVMTECAEQERGERASGFITAAAIMYKRETGLDIVKISIKHRLNVLRAVAVYGDIEYFRDLIERVIG